MKLGNFVWVKFFVLTACLMITLGQAQAQAGSAKWQAANIQYLTGNNFELGDKQQDTLTFEYANSWKYGDNYLFIDVTNPVSNGQKSKTDHYMEIHPRFSLNKILGKDLSVGPVKEVLIATQVEMGSGFHSYLYGVGFDLNIPKFQFFKLNFYVRDNQQVDGKTYQITPAWQLPFSLGSADFLFKGFVDFQGSEGNKEANINAQPALLLDIGKFAGAPKQFYVGSEYRYWKNQFGIDGVDLSVVQAMVQWNF